MLVLFTGREREKAHYNQLPRNVKSDCPGRRHIYMHTDSESCLVGDKPFLEPYLRLAEKNSKCNLSLFVPADTI